MNTVVVHRCHNDIEAEQIRELLYQEGIVCQVASDVPHSVFPLTLDGLGEVRIAVMAKEAERARRLISQFLDVSQGTFSEGEIPNNAE